MTLDDIALTLCTDPATVKHLIECFGSAEAVFAAGTEELAGRAGLRPDIARLIASRPHHAQAGEEMRYLERQGYKAVAATDEEYSPLLRECPDNPHVLYVNGATDVLRRPMLSVVGTRQVTSYGIQMCDRLIEGLAAQVPDLVIVSGLAFGIDVAAHRAAVRFGLATIGVLATPVGRIYPSFHADIAREMVAKGGAVVSEAHSRSATAKHSFPQRNRIVAGMSMGTLVVESPSRSGSLITADCALSYNRSVMAVPGRATDIASAGCNFLIRTSRALSVCSAEDIVAELGLKGAEFSRRKSRPAVETEDLTPSQAEVMRLLIEDGPLADTEIMKLTGMDYQQVCEALFVLECAGAIRMGGGKFSAC